MTNSNYHSVTLSREQWDANFDDFYVWLVGRDGGPLEVWTHSVRRGQTVPGSEHLAAAFEDTCMFDDQDALGEHLMDKDWLYYDTGREVDWSAELRFQDAETATLFKLTWGGM